MSITAAFFVFAGTLALADILGPGHAWGGLAALTGWFLFCRWLGPRGWNRLLTASLWLSVAVAAMAVAQAFITGGRAWGPFGSPNYLGAYSVLMFFLAVAARSSRSPGHRECREVHPQEPGNIGAIPLRAAGAIGRWLPAAANLLTLALSQSRGALLALGAGLAVWSLGQKRWLWVFALVPGVFALLIRPGNEEARFGIWSAGLQVAAAHSWLGWGQGGVGMLGYNGFYNIPLDVLIAGGIPALIAGAWLLAVAAKVAFEEGRPHLLAFLAAWFVQGLFLFSIPATSVLLVAVLARLSVGRGRRRGDVPDGAGLIDNHHDLRAGRRRLERLRAEQLQLAGLGAGREAHPVEDELVDLRQDARRVRRAGDRRRDGHHHADRQKAAEKETGEAGAKRVDHNALHS